MASVRSVEGGAVMKGIYLLLLLCACLASFNADAQNTCYQWRVSNSNGTTGWENDPQKAVTAWEGLCSGSGGCTPVVCSTGDFIGSYPRSYAAQTATGWPVYFVQQTSFNCTTGENTTSTISGMSNRTDPQGCPLCMAAGTITESIIEDDAGPGDTVCASDNCAYTVMSPATTLIVQGGTAKVSAVMSLGRACASTPAAALKPEQPKGPCTGSACLDAEGGSANVGGDEVNPDHVPPDSCVGYASGAVACSGSSTRPDNGTPGTPADPGATLTTPRGQVDYYPPDAVDDSVTPVDPVPGVGGPATGAPGAGGGSSTGGDTIINCEGENCVELEVDIEGECPEGQTCEGSLPDTGTWGTVCTFGECAVAFYNRVQNAPIVQSVVGAGASIPSGACPSWGITAFGDTNSLSAPMCAIFEDISPFLSAAFLVVWAWVATRIVLSA